MAPLTPFNPPLGPSLSQCHPQPVTLHMKEKAFSLSGDDFTVKTVDGVEICKCKGKLLSVSDKKVFTDVQGQEIFAMKNKHFTIHKTFHAENPKGHELFVITKKFTVLANESTVTFKNESDGRNVELDVRGTWYDRSASVTFGGEPVAHISRSIFNMREILADKDTYFVTVAPMVDLTMIAALCVSLDEQDEKK
ncbi:MAG: hypothetical protein ALECFALPRED_006486 [Alectoria fallacina]|uniref:Uncharacterized protein n=1 Tax=Alectoria fallacina TaxID=1903189 RepID=A0A8H3IWI2_9LECA|nr:MAG: hypothetical protein ALECFALPRED_006486 [Alectoria fallacina]